MVLSASCCWDTGGSAPRIPRDADLNQEVDQVVPTQLTPLLLSLQLLPEVSPAFGLHGVCRMSPKGKTRLMVRKSAASGRRC